MKNLLLILLLFVSAALLGQADTIPVDNSIDGGYGVSVFSGKPGVSWPGDTSRYTQIAYDKVRNILWGYDRNSESNVMLARELAFLADIGDTTTIGSSYNGMLAWAEDVQALYVRKQTGWELLSAGGGGSVTSVNAQTGVVVLDADDIDDSATTNKFTTAGDISKLAGIESGATANQTANEIKDSLETLAGVSRLDAAYIQNDTVTRMVNDSIQGYFVDGVLIGSDTIRIQIDSNIYTSVISVHDDTLSFNFSRIYEVVNTDSINFILATDVNHRPGATIRVQTTDSLEYASLENLNISVQEGFVCPGFQNVFYFTYLGGTSVDVRIVNSCDSLPVSGGPASLDTLFSLAQGDVTLSTTDVTSWNDTTSNLNHFIPGVSPTYVSADTSVQFNGSNDYLVSTNAPATGSYDSLSLFVEVDPVAIASIQFLLGQYNSGSNKRSFLLSINSSTYRLVFSPDGTYTNAVEYSIPATTSRAKVVFTFDKGTVTAYIDGVEQTLTTIQANTVTSIFNDGTEGFTMGKFPSASSYYNGKVYRAMLFKGVLSTAQINAL